MNPPVPDTQTATPPPQDSSPTTVDFLRHGQVATPDLFCAPSHEPLGIHGWKQLTLATQHGRWDAVVTSPSRRCHDFARLLAQRLDCPFAVEERFAEMDFGDWIGKTQAQLWEENPELMQVLWQQPRRFVAPNGEAMEDFTTRVQSAWADLLAEYTGQHLVVLTHAGVIRTILSHVLDILPQKALRFDIAHAHFTRIRHYPDGAASLLGHGLPQP